MSYIAGYQCIGCGHTLDFHKKEIVYVCPRCGENLEIVPDYRAVGKVFSKESLAENREMSLWRYLPLYPIESLEFISPLSVGWTPLYKAEKLGEHLGNRNLYIKDEGRNPSGSLKDRAGSVVLAAARERNLPTIAGASTGNAGSSMACLCASVGMSPVILVPEKAPKAKIAQLLLYGAKVIAVEGTYDDAFELCLKISDHLGWFNRNTGYNPFTREGKKSCSLEICEQLKWQTPDWILVSVGDGNIISGIWKGLKDLKALGFIDKMPRLGAVQSSKSNALAKALETYGGGPPAVSPVKATTVADSISVDMPRDGVCAMKAVLESKGRAVEVDDEDIISVIKTTASLTGVFTEPAGAASIAGYAKMLAQGTISPDERTVCVLTGNGLKDIDSGLRAAGQPIRIRPTLEEALRALQ